MASQDPTPPIVVGVHKDGSSHDALVFALEEGHARNARVVVVSAWTFGSTFRDAPFGDTTEAEEAKTRAYQDAEVTRALAATTARPEISPSIVHGSSGESLVDAARGATMLVVGRGRKGTLERVFLGSVSEYCLRHATVPVAIVPDTSDA